MKQFDIKALQSEEEILALRQDWDRLYQSNLSHTIYQSPDWILTWWKHYKKNNKLLFIAIFTRESLVALFPFVIESTSHIRELKYIANSLNDYNAPLMRSNYDSRKFHLLALNKLKVEFYNEFDYFNYDFVKNETSDIIEHIIVDSGWSIARTEKDIAVEMTLPKNSIRLSESIPKKRLQKFEYYERRLFTQNKIKFTFLDNITDLADYMIWFKKNKLKLWAEYGIAPLLSKELREDCFFKFLGDLIKIWLNQDKILVPIIWQDDFIIAIGIYISYNQRIFAFMHSWAFELKHLSIGIVTDWLMIKHAIENQYSVFDFGRGNEQYKYKFGGQDIDLTNYILKV